MRDEQLIAIMVASILAGSGKHPDHIKEGEIDAAIKVARQVCHKLGA